MFKDFLLSRILETGVSRHSEVNGAADQDWQQHIVLEVGPHPDLSELQKKVIELDYGMRDGKAEVPIRRAFLYYTLRRLGLNTDITERRAQDQQIVLLNPRSEERRVGKEWGVTSSSSRLPENKKKK